MVGRGRNLENRASGHPDGLAGDCGAYNDSWRHDILAINFTNNEKGCLDFPGSLFCLKLVKTVFLLLPGPLPRIFRIYGRQAGEIIAQGADKRGRLGADVFVAAGEDAVKAVGEQMIERNGRD